MNAGGNRGEPSLPLEALDQLNEVCWRFDADLHANKRPKIEDHLAEIAEPKRSVLRRRLAAIEAEFLEGKARVFSP